MTYNDYMTSHEGLKSDVNSSKKTTKIMITVYHDELKKQLQPIYKSILHVMKIDFCIGVIIINVYGMYIYHLHFTKCC